MGIPPFNYYYIFNKKGKKMLISKNSMKKIKDKINLSKKVLEDFF